jgi:hypothetical protein
MYYPISVSPGLCWSKPSAGIFPGSERIVLLTSLTERVIVLPYMPSIVAKKKANQLYYYVVESGRVEGKPRITHQVYLGTAEKVAALVQQRSAPVPVEATCRQVGLVAALWLAAQRSGVFALLRSLWRQPRSGPATAHYLLLAALHRICDPGPKTEVADWYQSTLLPSLWQFPPERFTSVLGLL